MRGGAVISGRYSVISSQNSVFGNPYSVIRRWVFLVALLALCVPVRAAEPDARLPERNQAFLNNYCMDCHDADTEKGEVNLEDLPLHITAMQQAELWQKVLNALNAGEMPPEKKPQPKNVEKADFLEDLSHTMVVARKVLSDSGGKITMRRLNQREYGKTIENLLGVIVDAKLLPEDGGSESFDTTGASQFMSSDQIEQYLALGRRAIDAALDRHTTQKRKSRTFRVEPEKVVNPHHEKIVERFEETNERFLAWKEGVDRAAELPENKAVMDALRRKSPRLAQFYYNVEQLKGIPDPKTFGFNDVQKAAFANRNYNLVYAWFKHYAMLPHRDQGTYLKLGHVGADGYTRIDVKPSWKMPPGTYILRVRVGAVEGAPESRRFIEVGHPDTTGRAKQGIVFPLSSHQITGTIDQPQIIETRVEVGADTIRAFSVQEKQALNGQQYFKEYFHQAKKKNGYGYDPAIWVDWVEIEGPIDDSGTRGWKERRQSETHANVKVGGTYEDYFKGGHDRAQELLKTQKWDQEIIDEQQARFRIARFKEEGAKYRRYLAHTLTKSGSLLTVSPVYPMEFIALPPEQPSGWNKTKHVVDALPLGNYTLRFRVGAVEGTPKKRHFVEVGAVSEDKQFTRIGTYQITGSTDDPRIIDIPVQLTIDGPRKFGLREKRNPRADEVLNSNARFQQDLMPKPALWVDWVEWEGPLSTDESRSGKMDWWVSQKDIPKEQVRAREILTNFLAEAFRGVTPGEDYLDRLVGIFESRRKSGETFDIAVRTPLSIILASPGFLYFSEPGTESEKRRLSDRELAVRLAYFLWSAPPDKKLLDLAETNQLHEPDVLRAQVDRMIEDSRSDEFVAGFVPQWLHMERLDFFQFDIKRHPEFDESMREATRQEVYQSYAYLLRNRDQGELRNLLKSDYVVINSLLGFHYGIPGVVGDHFRKVKLPPNSPRGGLLGMAAIHAMGSDGVHSSPVERGAWVLRSILNDPPPPAPPNVPQISRLSGQVLTTRERLLAHQEEPQCASCHRKIDPIGLGLENFTAAGLWRTTNYSGEKKMKKTWDIDASGKFHDGPSFRDYRDMRDKIATHQEQFARGYVEALVTYGLGRPFGFTDEKLAEGIMAAASSENYATSAFIQALVATKEFQSK